MNRLSTWLTISYSHENALKSTDFLFLFLWIYFKKMWFVPLVRGQQGWFLSLSINLKDKKFFCSFIWNSTGFQRPVKRARQRKKPDWQAQENNICLLYSVSFETDQFSTASSLSRLVSCLMSLLIISGVLIQYYLHILSESDYFPRRSFLQRWPR